VAGVYGLIGLGLLWLIERWAATPRHFLDLPKYAERRLDQRQAMKRRGYVAAKKIIITR
jgi:hypothetical protein